MSAQGDASDAVQLVNGETLTVDGLTLRVRTSPRRKRLAVSVELDAALVLHAPEGGTVAAGRRFVHEHRRWVWQRLRQRERTRTLSPAKRLVQGETFRYLGRAYRLSLSEDPVGTPVRLLAGRLVLPTACAAVPERGRAALVDWYCRVGRGWVVGRVQPWAARMDVPATALDVRDLGHRWGAYTPAGEGNGPGRVSLGWQLFQLPMPLVDYVIAHELAHVRVPGHGPDFWRLLGRALPEYGERRAELDELGRRMWMGEILGA